MTRTTCLVLAVAAVCGDVLAQSNERGPGYDPAMTNIFGVTDWGRRGAPYPNGEVGVSIANELCNPGTIEVEWRSPGDFFGDLIRSDHPKFGFLVAKEVNGRLVQISDWSYCKHAFFALANPSTCGGTCIPPVGVPPGERLGVRCSDIYSSGHNGDPFYLAPPAEINPWLGTWPAVGNYFDIGHPGQTGFPLPADQLRSLNVSGFDPVRSRVTLRDADITNGQSMYFQVHVVVEGERIENRGNNTMSRPFAMTHTGGSGQAAYTTTTQGTATLGTVLTRWTGATISTGTNGGTGTLNDADGRFQVAVKVTGPVDGFWHYEYAVMNLDNHRGGASFSLPVCNGGRVQNIGFRDIDQDPLNDWTSTFASGSLTWDAPANNPHNWNTLYNFWFDSDVGPSAGSATILQARPGPGALTVGVPTTVPGHQHAIYLGAGCGTPSTSLTINGAPTAGNAAFALNLTTEPFVPGLLFFSFNNGTVTLAPGCDAYLDLLAFSDAGGFFSDASGLATMPFPVPPGQIAGEVVFQAAPFLSAPPVLGIVGLSNGLKVRFASLGCD